MRRLETSRSSTIALRTVERIVQNRHVTDTPTTLPAPRAPKDSFASRLFGYDVFISFALGGPPRGSQSYASDLARRLRERDLSVFFSEDEVPPGEPLSDTLKRALLRSKLLVVIVNRGTLEVPNWVRTEVETFRSTRPGRPVIPVCLDGSFRDQALSDAVQPWLGHAGNIWLDEQADVAARGLATDGLVARLLTAPRRLRANTLWRALVGAVVLGLAALAGLAAWQAVVATRERDRAITLRDQALSRQLAAQSAASLVRDPVRALLLAAQSQAIVPTTASDSALLGAVASLPLAGLHQHTAAFQGLAVRPNSDVLVVSDVRGAVLQGEAGKQALDTLVPPAAGLSLYGTVHALAFAPDGHTWAHAGSSREITVHTGASKRTIPDGDKIGETTLMFVLGLAFSPDGAALVSASTSGSLRLHDLANGSSRLLYQSALDLASVAFSPDGRWVVAGGDRGFLQAVAVAPGSSAPKLEASLSGTVTALAFDAVGQRLFAVSRAGRIEVFDARDGRRIAEQEAPEQGALETMAVTPDGRFIATGHGSGAVLLWAWREGADGWLRQLLVRHAAPVRGLAFVADGRTLLTAGADGRLFVTLPVDRGRWQRRTGPSLVHKPPQPLVPEEVRSPDGRWIAWSGTVASKPSPFDIDLGRLSSAQVPRLTVLRGADRQAIVDGAELPADPGESINAGPVFAADSSQLAVQVGHRLLFWDLLAAEPLDAALALPPGTRLIGAESAGAGWLAGTDTEASEHFIFGTDRSAWVRAACTLAGRALTVEEWRRHVGGSRPYTPVCRLGS
jgi:WD40 repeat protein